MKASQENLEKTSRPYFLSSLHSARTLAARAVSPQEVALVDWEERKVIHKFRATQGPLKALALHPDGNQVAAVGEESNVKIYDAATGTSSLEISVEKPQSIAFGPEGKSLLVSTSGTLTAFDSTSGQQLWKREESTFRYPALLSLSPDQKLLAWSAFGGPRVHILDAANGEIQFTLGSPSDEVFAANFHPDSGRLAIVIHSQRHSAPFQVQVWRLRKEALMVPDRELSIINLSVAAAISPGGGTIATGDGQGAQLWDYAGGKPERRMAERQLSKVPGLGTVEHPRPSLAATLRFSADGKQLITDGEYLRVWNVETGDLIWTFTP